MATYVLSDIHGRLRPLDRALEAVSPTSEDSIFVLGDMVDRGPDPVGVLQLVRALPNTQALCGNHEALMLDVILHPHDTLAKFNWGSNGGHTTLDGLKKLPASVSDDLIDWVRELPFYAHTWAADKRYLLVHAGIRPKVAPVPLAWGDFATELFLSKQNPDDLLWIREGYLDQPTGLVGPDGRGPVVIAGHTPTLLATTLMDRLEASPEREEGKPCIAYMGAGQETGGRADRINIDCGCAAGPGIGRLAVLCLETGEVHYEDILDGE